MSGTALFSVAPFAEIVDASSCSDILYTQSLSTDLYILLRRHSINESYLTKHCSVVGVFVGAVEAGAGRRELEAVHGEGEVVVVRVVDEEAVVRVLLQALRVVALGDERARVTGVGALLDARRLAKASLIVICDLGKCLGINYQNPHQ